MFCNPSAQTLLCEMKAQATTDDLFSVLWKIKVENIGEFILHDNKKPFIINGHGLNHRKSLEVQAKRETFASRALALDARINVYASFPGQHLLAYSLAHSLAVADFSCEICSHVAPPQLATELREDQRTPCHGELLVPGKQLLLVFCYICDPFVANHWILSPHQTLILPLNHGSGRRDQLQPQNLRPRPQIDLPLRN